MARTVPAWSARAIPEHLRFISGLPMRSVDSAAPGTPLDWRSLGQAVNLTGATGRHGAQFAMAWKDTGITGNLAAGTHNITLALPVPDEDLARLRVRIWADAGAGVAGFVEMFAPLSATVAATAPGAFGRAASAALGVTADVDTSDADAGPFVAFTLRAQSDFTRLDSVHVDSLERGWGTYPGAGTTLPAGVSAGIVPVDDDETAIDSPLPADVVQDIRASASRLAERRQVRGCWADWVDVTASPGVYRPSGGLAPQRIPVMLPVPQGGVMKLTLASHVTTAPPSARKVWLCALTPGGSIEGPALAEWTISAATGTAVSTVSLPVARIQRRFDRAAPPAGLLGYLSGALIVEGAIPARDMLALTSTRTEEADDEIIAGGWVLNSLTLWGP